mmetsp:Transcript_44068/g.116521  ORF Transcript_44068/g.116521 Transcript_44068/m.116521 type:complete len:270 (-) Transcript_44068:2-811(-)
MRHANGRGLSGDGPKFTWSVAFLKVTAGKSALPFRASGSAWGCEARLPPTKRLTVLAFGLEASRFSSTDTTLSRPNFEATLVFFPLSKKQPSESKPTLPSLPRISGAPAVAKPTFTRFLGFGPRVPSLVGFSCSRVLTSNMYRPLLTPVLARAPPSRCCMPPSCMHINTLFDALSMTFMVVSATAKDRGSWTLGFLSAGASPSSSFGGSGAAGLASSLASSPFISSSLASASSVFCFLAGGAIFQDARGASRRGRRRAGRSAGEPTATA